MPLYSIFDPTMIILIPAIIISFWAQTKVNSNYEKYSKVRIVNGYTGQQIARMMLDEAGLWDVRIEVINSKLGDHYDPSSKILRLSPEVYSGSTISSAGIAAHEVGHAIQHKEEYKPLTIRNSIVPVVNLGSSLSWILFFLGIFLGFKGLTTLGILLFSLVVIFQLITLPVEFDASTRALSILKSRGILYGDETRGAEKVLNAAAMTYVAATLMAVSQLIRLIAISNKDD
ncbi:zinc metallopeptidase [Clostridium saccharobutylicum]|uniref:Putative membrane protease YugP n=1 Tax=Clostridium saccharobutylicum DSM 13864 TaxID=1345695 RepID=U5MRX1_CLOSA|nr:zinc metallopeptidase [Clostridium saccharobutylicum]AGX42371.1 putative membrane protease YugP [Clostridium saccharobutylicum DSM 13864]AQR89652.1 putative neutral zinc metallopeptidase [Clostridium saccharobutylicum]AQR99554.1 putative neutral zinc metallopeptidase [Clostridium saccharobutylicum]AQS09284.1 putative neutral zinc metallopeptidase [Clostridium saccharobutylicum]AQS13540.1 putative neutral zinc metallopeptidase [Clostridium saccharobutylicum]